MKNPQSELVELFLKSIRNIIHGNHVDGTELQLKESKVIPFDLRVSIYWDFQAHWQDEEIAGGNGASINHGQSKGNFDQQHSTFINDAKYNTENRYQFLNEYKSFGVQGLAYSDSNKLIKNYPTHSYWYHCSNCRGNGEVTCSGCHGSGRNTCHSCWGSGTQTETRYETDTWTKSTRVITYTVNCFSCGGVGRQTCTGCRGSGCQQCSSCSGHGYFTYYRNTSLLAVPSVNFLLDSDKYSDQLVNYLKSLSLQFLYEKISFNQFEMEQYEDTYELIRYYGKSFITDILTELRQQKHHILGYSNPPIPFQRSAIFDQLFFEEITALEALQNKSGKIPKSQALKFFNEFAGQPALDVALKNIALDRKVDMVDHSNIVAKACSYFITDNASKRLADGIHAILDKVSPAYHGPTWAILSGIFFIFCAILVEFKVEELRHFSFGEYFLTTLKFSFFALIIFVIFSAFIFLVSAAITLFKRRNVPLEYRQSMRNIEPFKTSLGFGVLVIIIASFYGYSALKQWTPKFEYTLISKVYSVSNTVLPQNTVQKFCVLWSKRVSSYDLPHICTSKYFINFQDEFTYRLYAKPILVIQQKINREDSRFKVDGVMGAKTREAARLWLNKRGVEISPNASVNEIATKMDHLDASY